MKTMPPPLLPLFRSRLQGELLALLYHHPNKEHSLSDLARVLKSSPRMIYYEVERLDDAGLVIDRREGRSRLIRANTSTPLFRPLSDLLSLTFGPLPILTEILSGIDGVSSAYIYGSWAARYLGESGAPPHDVDVLVVGTSPRSSLDTIAQTAEIRLLRPVNIRRISQESWDETPPTNKFLEAVKSRPLVQIPADHPSRSAPTDEPDSDPIQPISNK